MLALSRLPGESIMLDCKDGRITVLFVRETHNGGIRLAIDAPDSVRIIREELLDKPRKGAKDGRSEV